jgi:hypothetical protein
MLCRKFENHSTGLLRNYPPVTKGLYLLLTVGTIKGFEKSFGENSFLKASQVLTLVSTRP